MKRSSPLMRRTPLARTGFKRKEPKPFALADRKTLERHSAMKLRIKKPTVAEGSKYLAACRGEPCYLRVPGVCCGRIDTVVPCHSNQSKHGKGMGIKAAHEFTVPGCFACHAWLDQGDAPREAKVLVFDRALGAWAPARAAKMGIEMKEAA
ncbi:DUF1364 family protein [Paraburkholderia sp. CNPSo 3157]|uniref:DUF1364 family protein n=1 Tax=Paraburkholderia franconis TaxID=2654983 RepID=A0A7X1N9I8_9BURK|nr:nuclease domain-containing protein [Paraburkholderia franconis]MPW17897.1 DUF1364 family protein [Paraburkholderia franconis]